MMAWINLGVLVTATVLTFVFYVLSARPAELEKRLGARAYRRCTVYRFLSGLAMGIATACYVLTVFFPVPSRLPESFPWPWWGSVVIALVITAPSGYLMWLGMRDAGEETMIVKKEHTLYGGIYTLIRHPQAAGELPLWFAVAFACHSPFLVLYSIVWIPLFVLMCLAEERDLAIRYGKAYEEYKQRTGFLMPKRN